MKNSIVLVNLPKLPPAEEVYDYDTFQLQELRDSIKSTLNVDLNQIPEKWQKKAKKIIDLVELEIEERAGVEKFGQDCISGAINLYGYTIEAPKVNLNDFAACNIELERILREVQQRPQNYLQGQQSQIDEEEFEESVEALPQPIIDKLSSSIVSETSSKQSNWKNVHQGASKKQSEMHDFMKNLLKRTKVNDPQIVGAASGGKYKPAPSQPELSASEKVKLAKLQKREQTKHLQPQVSQNTQMGERTNQLTLGKPAFSNRDLQKKLQQQQKEKELRSKSQSRSSIKRQQQQTTGSSFTSKKEAKIGTNKSCDKQNNTKRGSQLSSTGDSEFSNFKAHHINDGDTVSQRSNADQKTQIQQNTPNLNSNEFINFMQTEEENNSKINAQKNISQNTTQNKISETSQQKVEINIEKIGIDLKLEKLGVEQKAEKMHQNQSFHQSSEQLKLTDSQLKGSHKMIKIEEKKLINENQQNNQLKDSQIQDSILDEQMINNLRENSEINNQKATFQVEQSLENQKQDQVNQRYEEDQQKMVSDFLPQDNYTYNIIKENQQFQKDLITKGNLGDKRIVNFTEIVSSRVATPQIVENIPDESEEEPKVQLISQERKSQSKMFMNDVFKKGSIEEDFEDDENENILKRKPVKELKKTIRPKVHEELLNQKVETQQKNEIYSVSKTVAVNITRAETQVFQPQSPKIENKKKETKIINDQNAKQEQVQKKKPRVPPAPRPKPQGQQQNSAQSKYIIKQLQFLDDNKLVDYTWWIPSFQHLFSGFYQQGYSHLDAMKEQYSVFQQHVDKVDKVDQLVNGIRPSCMQVHPNEIVYINDPRKLVNFASKTAIDIQAYIQRQIVFNERLSGFNQSIEDQLYFRVVKTKEEVYDIISRSFMRKREWTELPHGMGLRTSWNVLWTWAKPQIDYNKLIIFQKVNHFPFNKNISRKDLLKKNIEKCQKLGQKAAICFDIIPTTFLLPKEYVQFMERFYADSEREGDYNLWIMKPTSKSRGRGIQVVNDISQVMYAEPVVLQKYLKDPLLLKGFKFDMRIYVVVTSFNPLEAFLYQEGFARMTTQKFSLNLNEIKNQLVHLTNYSIQKNNVEQGDFTSQNSFGGSKISLKQLREQLYDKGIEWNHIWNQVQEIIIKSLVAVQNDIPNNPNAFELFGYDIIIDQSKKLRCWLLEVNASPSLARDYILDELIKQQLIDDIFDLIDIPQFDRSRLCEVLERRILEEQGNKSQINTMNNSKLQLNRDLNYILKGKQPRKYGEIPSKMGGFIRIAPSEIQERIHKLVQSYKITGSIRSTID